jgi:type II secretory pathway pseudopilin PulG
MKRRTSESGHLLLAVMIALTVMLIFLTVAAQQWSSVERRENEKELLFRGKQYTMAIKKYQMEHGGAYPTSLESLIEPGPRRLRYIRKLFRDPMAPDGKWGILIADPTGKGFINPNAPPEQEGVTGLEDLGQGLSSSSGSSSMEDDIRVSNARNEGKQKLFAKKSGFDDWLHPKGEDQDKEGKVSVTAPGQPTGPIVGVVSLYDHASFRRYHEHENYVEWTFSVFDLIDQNQQAKQPGAPAPTPGMFGYGGTGTMTGGGKCYGAGCNNQGNQGFGTQGGTQGGNRQGGGPPGSGTN